ncbi:MAG: DoxX family protein [Chitinophagales bacterium]|nr:DoxX family protein [Chitinophagales bacterium]
MKFIFGEIKNGNDWGILIIRVIFGLALFYGHGYGKLVKLFSGAEIKFLDPIGLGMKLSFYLATFADAICAIFLILGLFTRFTTIALIFTFLVILYQHGIVEADGFDIMELRYLYFGGFVALMFTGAGKYSLDHYLATKK